MTATTHRFSPSIPGDAALDASNLPDEVLKITAASVKLAGNLSADCRNVRSPSLRLDSPFQRWKWQSRPAIYGCNVNCDRS
jgi:hypothetical protein